MEQINCREIVVEYDSESDTYSNGYDSDDTVLSYDTYDCELYQSNHDLLHGLDRPINFSHYLKKKELNVT